MRLAISAAVLHDGTVLLTRKKATWIMPGGKPEPNEDELACLMRELEEEVPELEVENLEFYGEFEGQTPHKGDQLKNRLYRCTTQNPNVQPSAEILEVAWVSNPDGYNLSDITRKELAALKSDGYLE